jgi:hypothetical protein
VPVFKYIEVNEKPIKRVKAHVKREITENMENVILGEHKII